jgi:hypothetical protein
MDITFHISDSFEELSRLFKCVSYIKLMGNKIVNDKSGRIRCDNLKITFQYMTEVT